MVKVTIACTVDPTVLAKAKELNINISQTLEDTLRTLVLEKEPEFKTTEEFAILQENLKRTNRRMRALEESKEDFLNFINKDKKILDKWLKRKGA